MSKYPPIKIREQVLGRSLARQRGRGMSMPAEIGKDVERKVGVDFADKPDKSIISICDGDQLVCQFDPSSQGFAFLIDRMSGRVYKVK